MTPDLNGIDHIHVYVEDRTQAVIWYENVLGFTPVEALKSWAVDGGPLTIGNAGGTVHLALFEKPDHDEGATIAFSTGGNALLAWKTHLESKGIYLTVSDHDLSYSLYFQDPDGNKYEITTYDHDLVRARLT